LSAIKWWLFNFRYCKYLPRNHNILMPEAPLDKAKEFYQSGSSAWISSFQSVSPEFES